MLASLALAVFGFWKPCFAQLTAADAATHLHAVLMLAWFGLVIVQPLLVRTRRLRCIAGLDAPRMHWYR